MSADGLHRGPARPLHTPTLDELFKSSEPITSVDALARDEIFDEGEVEEFLAELYAMRRSDVASTNAVDHSGHRRRHPDVK